jgi:membrane protease YdiL (CAAX protease family)
MPWDFILILAFIATAVPLLGLRRIRQLMRMPYTTRRQRLSLYASTTVSQWIAVAILLWRCKARGISFEQLGLAIPDPRLATLVSVVLACLLITNQILAIRQAAARPGRMSEAMPKLALLIFPQSMTERLAFLGVAATVAICEEVIYRGFVQRTFQEFANGRVYVGIAISAIFFAVGHIYQGRRGMAATGVLGFVFSVVRTWTGGLVPCIVAHFATDLTVGLLAPTRLSGHGPKASGTPCI